MLSFESLSQKIAEHQLHRAGYNATPRKAPHHVGVYGTESVAPRHESIVSHRNLRQSLSANKKFGDSSVTVSTPAPSPTDWAEFATPAITNTHDPAGSTTTGPAPCYRTDYMPIMTRTRKGCNNIAEVDISTLLLFPNQPPNSQFTVDLSTFNAAAKAINE